MLTDHPPIGTVLAFPADQPAPDGWVVCDGARVYRRAFPDLYAALGGFRARWPFIWRRYLPDFRDYGTADWDGGIDTWIGPWVYLIRAR